MQNVLGAPKTSPPMLPFLLLSNRKRCSPPRTAAGQTEVTAMPTGEPTAHLVLPQHCSTKAKHQQRLGSQELGVSTASCYPHLLLPSPSSPLLAEDIDFILL